MSPRKSVRSLRDVDPKVLQFLGGTFALRANLLEKVLSPERIYFARFGEQDSSFHFHIFPRTKWIREEFLKAHSNTEPVIDGPRLLSWVRERFKAESRPPGVSLKDSIRELRRWAASSSLDRTVRIWELTQSQDQVGEE